MPWRNDTEQFTKLPVLSDPKHEAFARAVAAGATKRNAAIQAGYAESDASSRGSKLAAREEIKLRIAELAGEVQAAVCEKLAITTERICEEYAKIAFAECDLTAVTAKDKRGALDSLAKTLGMFKPEKVALTDKDGGPATLQVVIRSVLDTPKEN